ncbi:MAG: AAA family ATPase [Rhodoluna sp.]|nr:AAA family ATPase [Rhodoluna sp.]
MSDALKQLVDLTLESVELGNLTPIILIDGRAGSGKSTLAEALKNQLFKEGESLPRLIHMDDLYEGWRGLETGVDILNRQILGPLAKGVGASWQEWDWAAGERGKWREFRGGTPLVIEGVGALNRVSAEYGIIRVWLEVDEQVRFERWVEREGSDEHWAEWSAQELEFYARERSSELATLVFG